MENSRRLRSWKSKLKSANPFSRSASTSQPSTASSATELTERLRDQPPSSAPNVIISQSPSTTLVPATPAASQEVTLIPASHGHAEPGATASIAQPSFAPENTQPAAVISYQPDPPSTATHATQSPNIQAHSPSRLETAPPVNQGEVTTTVPVDMTRSTPRSTTQSRPQAGKFLDALRILKIKHAEEFERLEDGWKAYQSNTIDVSKLKLPQIVLDQPQSRELINRTKRVLPVLTSLKHTVMTIAALDPHKIAPICCSLFFTIAELTLNIPDPERRNKILEAFFEAASTIQEWISFETNYARQSAMKNKVADIEAQLPDLYVKCLCLIADIEHSVARKGITGRVANVFLNEPGLWDAEIKTLKNLRLSLTIQRKMIDERVAAQENYKKYIQYIKKDDDPEQSLEEIDEYVNPQKYERYAEWFLSSTEFLAWSKAFADSKQSEESKRALWISGPYGTGKTTIVHRTLSALKALENSRPPDEPLRVISYFCSARGADEKRPSYETVIRSLACKLSWTPYLDVSQPAIDFYNKWTGPGQGKPSLKCWEELLDGLLFESPQTTFLVDGLDAFLTIKDGERLLHRMTMILEKHPQVYFLCSSHRSVHVEGHFSTLYEHQVQPEDTRADLKSFIDKEIASAKPSQGNESVFFKTGCEDLLDTMKEILRDHANGMFIWVRVWLDILLPELNPQDIVRGRNSAQELLKEMRESSLPTVQQDEQLQTAYRRLWKRNEYRYHKEIRIHLFRLVLCALQDLSIAALVQALQVYSNDADLDHEVIDEKFVKKLGDNFLDEDFAGDLIFVHDSARAFVAKMKTKDVDDLSQNDAYIFEERQNHLYMAELYITVTSQPQHPLWQTSGIDFSMPTSPGNNRSRLADMDLLIRTWRTIWDERNLFLEYVLTHGLSHCKHAATKASIFDAVWTKFFETVVKPNNLALFISLRLTDPQLDKDSSTSYRDANDDLFTFRDNSLEFLGASLVVWLEILDSDDFSESELMSLHTTPSLDWTYRERRLASLLLADTTTSLATSDLSEALFQACWYESNVIVEFLLSGTYRLRGPQAVLDLLNQDENHKSAMECAVGTFHQNDVDPTTLETLLRFEVMSMKQINQENPVVGRPKDPPEQQWTFPSVHGDPLLVEAIERLKEDSLYHLIEICPPLDIEMDGEDHWTPLHAATGQGYLRLVQKFVEEFGARNDIEDFDGRTALDVARRFENHACVEYLENLEWLAGFNCFSEDVQSPTNPDSIASVS